MLCGPSYGQLAKPVNRIHGRLKKKSEIFYRSWDILSLSMVDFWPPRSFEPNFCKWGRPSDWIPGFHSPLVLRLFNSQFHFMHSLYTTLHPLRHVVGAKGRKEDRREKPGTAGRKGRRKALKHETLKLFIAMFSSCIRANWHIFFFHCRQYFSGALCLLGVGFTF